MQAYYCCVSEHFPNRTSSVRVGRRGGGGGVWRGKICRGSTREMTKIGQERGEEGKISYFNCPRQPLRTLP